MVGGALKKRCLVTLKPPFSPLGAQFWERPLKQSWAMRNANNALACFLVVRMELQPSVKSVQTVQSQWWADYSKSRMICSVVTSQKKDLVRVIVEVHLQWRRMENTHCWASPAGVWAALGSVFTYKFYASKWSYLWPINQKHLYYRRASQVFIAMCLPKGIGLTGL